MSSYYLFCYNFQGINIALHLQQVVDYHLAIIASLGSSLSSPLLPLNQGRYDICSSTFILLVSYSSISIVFISLRLWFIHPHHLHHDFFHLDNNLQLYFLEKKILHSYFLCLVQFLLPEITSIPVFSSKQEAIIIASKGSHVQLN